jgi:hypothetical protein
MNARKIIDSKGVILLWFLAAIQGGVRGSKDENGS